MSLKELIGLSFLIYFFYLIFNIDHSCGKTTQCNLLTDYLKSKVSNAESTKFIRFPNRTSTIGTLINSYLASGTDIDDHTIHLLFSSNRWEQVCSFILYNLLFYIFFGGFIFSEKKYCKI